MARHRGAKRPRLSLCMIALNEQDLIGECLRSVRGLVDEIILGLDTRTTDRTGAIARGHGARVIPIDWRDDFSYARNITLEAARGDWILVLDADDRLAQAGARFLKAMRDRGDAALGRYIFNAVMFEVDERRLDGSRIVSWHGAVRLFRRSANPRYINRVHETVPVTGDTAKLMGGPHVVHLGRDPSIYALRDKDMRNFVLLQLVLEESPHDPFLHYYLARHYALFDEPARAQEHARTALVESERAEAERSVWLSSIMTDELRQLVDTGRANWLGSEPEELSD